MKRQFDFEKIMEQSFGCSAVVSEQQVASAWERVSQRIGDPPHATAEDFAAGVARRMPWMIPALVIAAAAVFAVAVSLTLFHRSSTTMVKGSGIAARVGQDVSALALAFEVASIRPTSLASGGERGLGAATTSIRPALDPCGPPNLPRVDPQRFSTTDTTAIALILWAYGKECNYEKGSDLVSGGPAWIRSEGFDIQAKMPEGTPAYTAKQLRAGAAPKLQAMLQALLADRFKLTTHVETRETAVYILKAGLGTPKLTPAAAGDAPSSALVNRQSAGQAVSRILQGRKQSMGDLARVLEQAVRHPVIDRTGISGEFNFRLEFASDDLSAPSPFPVLADEIRQTLGLTLEAAKTPMEMLVIDHLEKPSSN